MTVFEVVRTFLCDQCGCCFEDVTLSASLDELNILDYEREHLAFLLGEVYETEIDTEALMGFETVGDLVVYVEDRF